MINCDIEQDHQYGKAVKVLCGGVERKTKEAELIKTVDPIRAARQIDGARLPRQLHPRGGQRQLEKDLAKTEGYDCQIIPHQTQRRRAQHPTDQRGQRDD